MFEGQTKSVAELKRPRDRVALAHSTQYLDDRAAVVDFLYRKQGHPTSATSGEPS